MLRRVCSTIFGIVVVSFVVMWVGAGRVKAVGPAFSLYPNSGYAILNQEFVVDILLDTGGRDTTSARAVLTFTPSQLQIVRAQFGSLYCQYPDDDYISDNTNGKLVLTGFCLDPYYSSSGTPGLFGRITFRPLIEGTANVNFSFTGTDVTSSTVIKDIGSPPINILAARPTGGSFSVVTQIPSTPSRPTTKPTLPGVGIFDNKTVIIGVGLVVAAVVLIVGGRIWSSAAKEKQYRDSRTVIL